MKNYRIIKGKKIHVNQLASMSRLHSVKNNTIGSKLKTVVINKGAKDETKVKVVEQNGILYHQAGFTKLLKTLGSETSVENR